MSSTPEITNLGKISPLGSNINKNLLTPCRRVGLSRKRKTPNSIVRICSQNSPLSSNDKLVTGLTPVNHRKSIIRENSHISPDIEFPSILHENSGAEEQKVDTKRDIHTNNVFAEKKLKKDLFQNYSDDLFNDSDSSVTNHEVEPVSKDVSKISKTGLTLDRTVNISDYVLHENIKFGMRPSNTDSVVIKDVDDRSNISEQYMNRENYSDEDFRMIKHKDSQKQKTKQKLNRKRIKKTLSLNKSIPVSDDEFDISPNQASSVKECSVPLQRITKNKNCLSEKNQSVTSYKTVDRLVDIVTEQEEDAFTSTPEQEKNKKVDMVQNIKTMEKIVKQKQQQFADLKQASIYKTKHNVEELKQLTSRWMIGCVLALKDLLAQLQAHGPMDMNTLLNNLHIPSDIVTKLSLSIK